ncbi:ATP synthase epsilon chain, partial [Frankliniella fusca]
YHLEVQKRVSITRMRPAMQRVRKILYPDPPGSLAALAEVLRNNPLITMTKDGRDNIYGASVTAADGSQSIIFTSRRVIEYASINCQWLFGDGTFLSLPAIPTLTAASQRRKESAYDAVLQTIKAFMSGGENVTNVVTDFEVAQQNSWANTFPHAKLQGCFFHMVRAFVRYAKEELHLTAHLRVIDGLVRRFIRLCCAIPLLPQKWLLKGLGVVMGEARQEGNRTYRLLRPFFEYIFTNWINQRQKKYLMSVYGSLHRTNNTCESHHRQLNKFIQVAHPNVYDFNEALVSIEESTWINSQAFLDGIRVGRSRKATSIANDIRLRRLARDLSAATGLVGAALEDRILRNLHAAAYTFARAYDNAVQND